MYNAGSILYFPDFQFKNGKPSKPKYSVVLKALDEEVLLASLPSGVDHLPRFIEQSHGCMEIPEGRICCYIFKAGQVIPDSGWTFSLDTYLYGEWIDEYEISLLTDLYPIENIDYEIKGSLTNAELTALTACFAASASVKRKYKQLLGN